MQPGVLGGDGQAQPAALAAGAGRVALGEAVEDMRQQFLGDARSAVGDGQSRAASSPARARSRTGTEEPPWRRALPRRLARTTSMRRGSSAGAQAVRHGDLDPVLPVAQRQGLADEFADIDLVEVQHGGAGVEPGDLHQVLDHAGEMAGLVG